jgi:hypothetical protein
MAIVFKRPGAAAITHKMPSNCQQTQLGWGKWLPGAFAVVRTDATVLTNTGTPLESLKNVPKAGNVRDCHNKPRRLIVTQETLAGLYRNPYFPCRQLSGDIGTYTAPNGIEAIGGHSEATGRVSSGCNTVGHRTVA